MGKRKYDTGLPARMYRKGPSFYYVSRENKWIRLGRTLRDALVRYAELVEAPENLGTMAAVFDRYLFEVVPTKAPRTQLDNHAELRMLRSALGHMRPADVRPKHIYAYLDARVARVRANREKALLSSVFSYAIRWGLVESNPCRDVKGNTERPRRRYVTDADFAAVLAQAPAPVRCAMVLAALTGLRQGDVLALRWSAVSAEGITVEQRKTGRRLLFQWTPDLRAAVSACEALHGDLGRGPGRTLVVGERSRERYTSEGFKSVWQRTMNRAMAAGLTERFTFHDIRAKAGSEAEDERLLGHVSTAELRRVYQRAPVKVTPVR